MGSIYKNGKYTYFSYRENGKNICISLGDVGTLSNGDKKYWKRNGYSRNSNGINFRGKIRINYIKHCMKKKPNADR